MLKKGRLVQVSGPGFVVVPFDFKAVVNSPLVARVLPYVRIPPPDWKIGKAGEAAALKEAAVTGRVILALFTSPSLKSCTYCVALENEVLSTALFASWARDRVVLLKVDFTSPSQPQESVDLEFKYNVLSIPTALALNPQGVEIGRLVGYSMGTGAKNWLMGFESVANMNQVPFPQRPIADG